MSSSRAHRRARLRVIGSALRERLATSLFFVPVLFVLGSMVLGQLAVTLDGTLDIDAADVPLGVASTVASARAVLSTVAGATITVAGIALSISILTLQIASSQYSPRVVSGLFRDPFNKRVIGIVVGTFAYCLVVLRAVRSGVDSQDAVIPNVSVTLGLLLGIVAILAIVAFINHNAHTMDISEILAIVSHEAVRSDDGIPPGELEPAPNPCPSEVPPGRGEAVRFERDGWVQIVDAAAMLAAVPEGSTVRLDTAVGRYAFRNSPLCTIWPAPPDRDEVHDRIHAAVKVGRTRTLRQDPSYGLRQLADVAIKALSPGINDPTTAQDAIFHLTSVLHELLERPSPAKDLRDGGRRLVLPQMPGHEEWVALAYDEIRLAAAPHPAVCVYLLESIDLLLQSLDRDDPAVELLLRHRARLVVEELERSDPSPEDLRRVRDVYTRHFGPAARPDSLEPA
jgi:uncharacterized membrane protein